MLEILSTWIERPTQCKIKYCIHSFASSYRRCSFCGNELKIIVLNTNK